MMNLPAPIVTVITVVLNDAAGFRATALSVTGQDYTALEFIVIDGGSVDGTAEVIREFSGKITRLVSEPDKGIYDAMNKGIRLASGDFIVFMNAGDSFFTNHSVTEVINARRESAAVIYGDSVAAYPGFRVLRKTGPIPEPWKGLPFSHQSMFTPAELLKKRGFDTGFTIAADYELVYRLFSRKTPFEYVPVTVCVNDVQGISNKHYLKSWRERRQIFLRYGNVTRTRKLYYLALFLIFALTGLLYKVLPEALMRSLLRLIYRKNII